MLCRALSRTARIVRKEAVRDFSVLERTRARLLAPLRSQLTQIDGWEQEEDAVSAKAAMGLGKVLSLGPEDLRSLASQLAKQGNQSCQHSLSSPDISKQAEVIALAYFERQYSRLLMELVQERTDFWGEKQAICTSLCSIRTGRDLSQGV